MTFKQLKEKADDYIIYSYDDFIEDFNSVSITRYEDKLRDLEKGISDLFKSIVEKSDTVKDLRDKVEKFAVDVNTYRGQIFKNYDNYKQIQHGKKIIKLGTDRTILYVDDRIVLFISCYVTYSGHDYLKFSYYVKLNEQEYCKIKMLSEAA